MITHQPDERPLVVELIETCSACPSQWEGTTDDEQYVYIRYRRGCLEVGLGETMKEAIRDRNHVAQIGDSFHGVLSEQDMKEAAKEILRFQ